MPQPVSIIAVRIPQGNLVEPLPDLLVAIMLHFAWISLIRQESCQPRTQPQAIIRGRSNSAPPSLEI